MPQYKEGDLVRVFAVDGAKWAGIPPEGTVGQIKSTARKIAVVGYGDEFRHEIKFYMEDGREADNYHHRYVLAEKEAEEFVRRQTATKALSKLGLHLPSGVKFSVEQIEAIWDVVKEAQGNSPK